MMYLYAIEKDRRGEEIEDRERGKEEAEEKTLGVGETNEQKTMVWAWNLAFCYGGYNVHGDNARTWCTT